MCPSRIFKWPRLISSPSIAYPGQRVLLRLAFSSKLASIFNVTVFTLTPQWMLESWLVMMLPMAENNNHFSYFMPT